MLGLKKTGYSSLHLLRLKMKKLFSFPFALMLAFTLAFSGCTKEEDEPDDPNGPVTPVNTSEFKWTVNNGTTPVIADSAVYYHA